MSGGGFVDPDNGGFTYGPGGGGGAPIACASLESRIPVDVFRLSGCTISQPGTGVYDVELLSPPESQDQIWGVATLADNAPGSISVAVTGPATLTVYVRFFAAGNFNMSDDTKWTLCVFSRRPD